MALLWGMSWKNYLIRNERSQLERAERNRDKARAEYNALRIRLKSRAEARARRESGLNYGKD